MILQAATEAAKSTSTIVLDGVAIMALITAGSVAAREYFKSRKARNGSGNGRGSKPGTAQECLEHRDKLNRLDERWTGMKEDITEIKGNVNKLLDRIPPRE
jgi:hypothetical protein